MIGDVNAGPGLVLAWSVKQQQLKIEKSIIFQVFFQGSIGGDVLGRGLTGRVRGFLGRNLMPSRAFPGGFCGL